ncbi:CotO family spore coat protein [Bacillus badius]|uniref:CotO family spore coat protein n=1 Tax=Bacillus badius TaxID=1455 RepID=UPI002E2183DD|nr:CotO family spore coat protein [Bacillus badius]
MKKRLRSKRREPSGSPLIYTGQPSAAESHKPMQTYYRGKGADELALEEKNKLTEKNPAAKNELASEAQANEKIDELSYLPEETAESLAEDGKKSDLVAEEEEVIEAVASLRDEISPAKAEETPANLFIKEKNSGFDMAIHEKGRSRSSEATDQLLAVVNLLKRQITKMKSSEAEQNPFISTVDLPDESAQADPKKEGDGETEPVFQQDDPGVKQDVRLTPFKEKSPVEKLAFLTSLPIQLNRVIIEVNTTKQYYVGFIHQFDPEANALILMSTHTFKGRKIALSEITDMKVISL